MVLTASCGTSLSPLQLSLRENLDEDTLIHFFHRAAELFPSDASFGLHKVLPGDTSLTMKHARVLAEIIPDSIANFLHFSTIGPV